MIPDELQKLSTDLFNLGAARGNMWLQTRAMRLVEPGMPPSAEDIATAKDIVSSPGAQEAIRSGEIAAQMVR